MGPKTLELVKSPVNENYFQFKRLDRKFQLPDKTKIFSHTSKILLYDLRNTKIKFLDHIANPEDEKSSI